MEEKINFAPTNPTPTSSPNEPPKDGKKPEITINTSGASSQDIKSPFGSPNHLLSPEPTPPQKVDIESALNQKSAIESLPTTSKKSNTLLFVIGGIILFVVGALASGIGVYYWLSTQIQPLQKDKALLQSQVGNLKSEVDVLKKENTNLQSDIDTLEEAAKAQPAPVTQPATGGDQTNPAAPLPQPNPTPVPPTAPVPGSTPTQ